MLGKIQNVPDISFGEILRKLRKEKGLTRPQLSEKTGLKVAAIDQYERNKRKPNFEAISKLEKFYNINVSHLTDIEVGEKSSETIPMSTNNDMEEFLKDLYVSTCSDIMPSVSDKNEYLEATAEYDRIYNDIESLLPENKRDLMEELYSAEATQNNIFDEVLFMKGLQYGVELARLLKIS